MPSPSNLVPSKCQLPGIPVPLKCDLRSDLVHSKSHLPGNTVQSKFHRTSVPVHSNRLNIPVCGQQFGDDHCRLEFGGNLLAVLNELPSEACRLTD